jgi:hypothetical protein
MPDATINGQRTKPLPAATQAQMKRGVPARQAIATTTNPKSSVKVG